MVPTFIIDWPFLIFLGLLYGFALKNPEGRPLFRTRAFVAGTLVLFLFIVVVFWSYRIAPDWMWMYFVEAMNVPGWIVGLILFGYYLTFLLGFLLKFELAKLGKGFPGGALVLSVAASGMIILPVKDRYLNVTTTYGWRAGILGKPLPESDVASAMNMAVAGLIVIGLLLFLWARREKT
ncbi:MAG: hypothetical protein HYS22_05670 [Deltaproteobacteria bacterium]|nr:hypothetical protein [Deltaproteobacteria bacterium]